MLKLGTEHCLKVEESCCFYFPQEWIINNEALFTFLSYVKFFCCSSASAPLKTVIFPLSESFGARLLFSLRCHPGWSSHIRGVPLPPLSKCKTGISTVCALFAEFWSSDIIFTFPSLINERTVDNSNKIQNISPTWETNAYAVNLLENTASSVGSLNPPRRLENQDIRWRHGSRM